MARVKWNITNVYQLVAAAPAVIDIKKRGKSPLLINTTDANDDTAMEISPEGELPQAEQRSTVNTWVRARDADDGYVIVVDQ